MRKLLVLILILAILYVLAQGATRYLPQFTSKLAGPNSPIISGNVKIVSEESVIIDVIKKVSPSVVSIGVDSTSQANSQSPYSFFFGQTPQTPDSEKESYIGSGFIIKSDGIIVTNKHVVSDNTLKYFVVDNKGNKYTISNIYRDPLNDLALIKISNPPATGLSETPLGDSSNLQVGQLVVAVGTPLGQFRNSATHGIISGLGRGITAGSAFEGFVERLDDVIQTDAAINPGNSGGPLLNSSGQVIGINTAVAAQGQNIGFAIPINVIKDSLKNFNETGQFNRPYLGVAYRMIPKQTAVMNDVPEGALVQEVVPGSAADKAGLQKGDIITQVDGQKLTADGNTSLSALIAKKKIGDTMKLTTYRDGKTVDLTATLQQAPNQ